MKKMRRLIPAIAMLLVSAVMLSTASFAWFTMSSEAKADGMTVTATADSTLLITKEYSFDAFNTANGLIDFTGTTRALTPATRWVEGLFSGYELDDEGNAVVGDDGEKVKVALEEPTSGLVTIADASTVTAATGAYDGFYSAVGVATDSKYYIDYTFYIGESGAASDKALNAYFDAAALKYSLHNAVTIDVYVDSSVKTDGAATYVDTVSLYEINTATDNEGTVKVEIADSIPNALVPNEAGTVDLGDAIQIVLRVYFDGNLKDATTANTNDYFVRNGTATTEGVSFFVDFKAE